jgi:HK97 gp10 family phage protein
MSKVNVKIEGVEKTISNLKKWNEDKRRAVSQAAIKTAIQIASEAKPNCPKRFGRLRASLTANWSGSGMTRAAASGAGGAEDGVGQPDGPPGLVAVAGSNVAYAHMQEFGSWGDGPVPTGKQLNPPKRDHEPWARPKEGFQFLTRSYIANEGKFIKRVEEALKKDEHL